MVLVNNCDSERQLIDMPLHSVRVHVSDRPGFMGARCENAVDIKGVTYGSSGLGDQDCNGYLTPNVSTKFVCLSMQMALK